MLNFVARVFRTWMSFLLWLILIGCIIGGFILGGSLGNRGFSIGYAFFGLIVGTFFGFVTIIFSGGIIANFLNMVDNIESVKYYLSNTGNTSGGNSSIISGSSSGLNLNDVMPIRKNPIISDDTAEERKKCKNCGLHVSTDKYKCPRCGGTEYIS